MTCRWFRREMNTDVKQFIESIVSCKLPKSIYSILLVLGDCLSQPSYSVPMIVFGICRTFSSSDKRHFVIVLG
jgi:hypothetical protein